MPAEPMPVEQPKHPIHALTTYELRDYRRQLEHAVKTLPEHATVRALIRLRLDAVLAEQAQRSRIRQGR